MRITGKHKVSLALAVAICGALLLLQSQRSVDPAASRAAIRSSAPGDSMRAPFDETVEQREPVQSVAPDEEPLLTAGRRLSLLVMDPDGRPIDGALVESIPEGLFSGTTEATGLLECEERSFSRPPLARISALGRGERRIYLDWAQSRITVVLRPEILLRGILTPPACNPATVLCWERDSPPPFEELSRYKFKTTTLPDGTFSLSGLSEDRQYHVQAASSGWAVVKPALIRVSEGDGDGLVLSAQRLYGACIRFVEGDGDPLSVSASLMTGRHDYWTSEDERLRPTLLYPVVARLAGVPETYVNDEMSTKLCLFASDLLEPQLGPCEYYLRLPGYEEVDMRYMATPLESLTESVCALTELASERGTISVRLENVPQDVAGFLGSPIIGALNLRRVDGSEETFQVVLSSTAPSIVEGIPAGSYEWRVKGTRTPFAWPTNGFGSAVHVRGDETCEIDIDCTSLGCIVLDLHDSLGVALDGQVSFSLAPGQPALDASGRLILRAANRVQFGGRPYCIPVFGPAEYTVRGIEPELGPPADEAGYLVISVGGGQVEELQIITR